MFSFSYHFRSKFRVNIVRHITCNSVVEIYVTVVCLVYQLRIPERFEFKTRLGNNLSSMRLSVDVHEFVHRDTIMKVTNKVQLYRLIYYS
jgi:hypothetical protein